MWFRNDVRLLKRDHGSGASVISANDHVCLSPAVDVRVIQVILFQSRGLKKIPSFFASFLSDGVSFTEINSRKLTLPSFIPISIPILASRSCLFVISPARCSYINEGKGKVAKLAERQAPTFD